MKRPISPVAPAKPTKPSEFLSVRRISKEIYEGDNLEEIIQKIGNTDLSLVGFGYDCEADYDGCRSHSFSFSWSTKETRDPSYDEKLKVYKQKLNAYKQAMVVYSNKLKDYESLQKQYLKWFYTKQLEKVNDDTK